ncbi:protein SMG9-like, partial [Stegodyphus dumicola]|uniref:protein SMG9-like n=1 Tax=Stegodyphus dumicola TaxID=202533 RepID=UPI0015A893C0
MAPPLKVKDTTLESETGAGKTLVILAKPPDKNKSNQSANTLTTNPTTQTELLKSPTIAQKSSSSSEQDEISVAASSTSSANKDDPFSDVVKNVVQRFFHVQQKTSASQSEGEQKLSSPPEMSFPVKLVDESLQWCDTALEYLHDSTDFYVIGVLGLQGVGKSTVMSIIGGNYGESSKWQLFKPQTNYKEIGEHCTTGIDMYVTNQRLILLDTQPVMSASVMDHMIQYEKKPPGGPDYHSVENALLMQSLQQAAFLMAVCHTIISVQDWFIDLNYLRFLLSAEMLKPTTPINIHDMNPIPEEMSEYYPHIVFVQNQCQREDFYPDSIAKMQDTLYLSLQKSKLKFS